MRSFGEHITPDSDYYVYTPGALAQKLFFYPICVGHFIYEPGYFLQRNRYDSFLLMFISGLPAVSPVRSIPSQSILISG